LEAQSAALCRDAATPWQGGTPSHGRLTKAERAAAAFEFGAFVRGEFGDGCGFHGQAKCGSGRYRVKRSVEGESLKSNESNADGCTPARRGAAAACGWAQSGSRFSGGKPAPDAQAVQAGKRGAFSWPEVAGAEEARLATGKHGGENPASGELPVDAGARPGMVSGMILVEAAESSLRVTIPTDEVPPERVSAFVDWLRLEALARRSRLTEEEAGQMAEAAKASWWAANKDRFIPPGEA
jgi:hypothetical protein